MSLVGIEAEHQRGDDRVKCTLSMRDVVLQANAAVDAVGWRWWWRCWDSADEETPKVVNNNSALNDSVCVCVWVCLCVFSRCRWSHCNCNSHLPLGHTFGGHVQDAAVTLPLRVFAPSTTAAIGRQCVSEKSLRGECHPTSGGTTTVAAAALIGWTLEWRARANQIFAFALFCCLPSTCLRHPSPLVQLPAKNISRHCHRSIIIIIARTTAAS